MYMNILKFSLVGSGLFRCATQLSNFRNCLVRSLIRSAASHWSYTLGKVMLKSTVSDKRRNSTFGASVWLKTLPKPSASLRPRGLAVGS